MNIGQAAEASGLPAKMIRYYETIGLVPPARRLKNGYRDYDATAVHRLRFVRCARDVGLSLEKVSELLSLWSDRKRSRSEVKAAALANVAELEDRAADLADMIETMRRLARASEQRGRQRATPSSPAKRARRP
jgi:Cu(I)-responsive transcriptional regulator